MISMPSKQVKLNPEVQQVWTDFHWYAALLNLPKTIQCKTRILMH